MRGGVRKRGKRWYYYFEVLFVKLSETKLSIYVTQKNF
ncbi:hypothetical protein OKM_01719 [Enterococcus faecium EnGen0041]|nr:hypothetical protein OKM_01719 [Enterococcus faecium EnGen0041]